MKIFLSFSGETSRQVALALHDWLRRVIQAAAPWISDRDIDSGATWTDVVAVNLRTSHMGIVCLTPENKDAPWLHFEAGALWRNVDAAYVCPYLFGIGPADVTGALMQFQSRQADEEGTFKLVETINSHPALQGRLSPGDLREAFDVWWPRLRERLGGIETGGRGPRVQRPLYELAAETLELVRNLSFERDAGPPSAALRSAALRNAAGAGAGGEERGLLTIDPRPLVGETAEAWRTPYRSFPTVQHLLDDIFLRLDGTVPPFTYGSLWLLRDKDSGRQFPDLGNNWAKARGLAVDDRPPEEVGLRPGMELEALSVLDPRVKMLRGT